jgi:hypothetical protein
MAARINAGDDSKVEEVWYDAVEQEDVKEAVVEKAGREDDWCDVPAGSEAATSWTEV